ncbi:Ppx/GppA family phosphatase [Bdellovibrio bacteriovorus]|uniref:Ppx/GppA phosphatase family protein n=1 Tax=Bdellovibrio bacteriovorus TaxID=959 RepID=UPI0021CEFE87|nr:Ppx/GppA phosphatase family protein [Bdellovibrio bacteriovorus]UXR65683.1 Ppx/GppA family phosphatase [Bdellovibrio bacteriovorus]
MKKVAALDLGTNTFLCLIADGDENGIRKVHRDLVQVVRLGQGVGQTGEFHPDALDRARKCLTEFKKEIVVERVDQILAMATSAARDARNGQELFRIGEELGIPIEIIPGEDEARITYQGATAGAKNPNLTSLVVDVGGGSTELIVGKASDILFGESLDIGGVRLTEKFISTQPVKDADRSRLESYIQEQLQKVLPELKKHHIDQIVAVAGTPTSLVAIEVGGFDEAKVDGFFLKKDRLHHWVEEFARTTVEEKKTKYQLGGRADIIFAGASILLAVVEALGLEGMMVSTKGVRYGVALEMLRSR